MTRPFKVRSEIDAAPLSCDSFACRRLHVPKGQEAEAVNQRHTFDSFPLLARAPAHSAAQPPAASLDASKRSAAALPQWLCSVRRLHFVRLPLPLPLRLSLSMRPWRTKAASSANSGCHPGTWHSFFTSYTPPQLRRSACCARPKFSQGRLCVHSHHRMCISQYALSALDIRVCMWGCGSMQGAGACTQR